MGQQRTGDREAREGALVGDVAERLRVRLGAHQTTNSAPRHRQSDRGPAAPSPGRGKELAVDALSVPGAQRGHTEAEAVPRLERDRGRVPQPGARLGRQSRRLENGPERELPEVARGYRLRTEPGGGPAERGKPADERAAHMGD